MEAYIERIKEVNPFLNAVVEERFEAAVNDAEICDANLKTGKVNVATLEREKPLYGVPVTIKETCSLAGERLPVKTHLTPTVARDTCTRTGRRVESDPWRSYTVSKVVESNFDITFSNENIYIEIDKSSSKSWF